MAALDRALSAAVLLLPLLVIAGCTGDSRTPTSPGVLGFDQTSHT